MSKLILSVVAAFNADVDLHAALDKALPSMSAQARKAFVIDTANALAEAASLRYDEAIQTYDGQRGIAFGVWDEEAGKMVRTPACDNTRKWFARNIVAKFNPVADKVEPSAIWGKIAKELTTIKSRGAKLPITEQRKLFAALAELEAEFFG
jgi:hypothetical protein